MSLRGWLRQRYGSYLARSLSATPDHAAVIQDGNRRYAESQGLERSAGHVRGASTTEELLNWCLELDISTVTLYTFSTENFNRPTDEQESLFDLITEKLYEFADADRIHKNTVRICGLGDIEQLPPRVQNAVEYAEQRTQEYDRLQLNIALAYGGRHELLKAAQTVARGVTAGTQSADAVTTETIESALYRESLPDVDLLLRTGGDQRTSNFLPWHAVGAEAVVYFSEVYWPEFSRYEFLKALHTYADRDQTFRQRQLDRANAIADTLANQAPLVESPQPAGDSYHHDDRPVSADGGSCEVSPESDVRKAVDGDD